MNFLSTALYLALSLALHDPRSCFAAGQDCGEDDKCGHCKKEYCPDLRERRRCKKDNCSLEELVALFPGDLVPELDALDGFRKVQKGSEVKQLRDGATAEKKKKKKKKGGKKGRGATLGPAGLAGNTYTAVGITGANEALILSTLAYDETGINFAGESMLNLPNPPRFEDPTVRFVFPAEYDGTIDELNDQGTGQQTTDLRFPTIGAMEIVPISIEVTGVVGSNIETMRQAFQIPSNGIPGALLDLSLTRRRADGYTDRSLRGLYSIVCNSGIFTGFASGKLTSDGEGGLSGAMTLNDPDPEDPISLRKIVATGVTGTYEVEDNGFGTVSLTYEADGFESGPSSFVVRTNRGPLITGMTMGFAAAAPLNGGLVTCELDSIGPFFSEDDNKMTMQ